MAEPSEAQEQDAPQQPEPENDAESAEETVEVSEADLPQAEPQPAEGDAPSGQVDILLDTAMNVTASLGETEILVRDLLEMGPGSVLTLDRQVGEPVDLYLRGIRFATGDLVIVGESLGVRIREILASGREEQEG
ncbi:MAG: FliM/FliN family flagellar motor switch protein [Phycisphaerae bacterium]